MDRGHGNVTTGCNSILYLFFILLLCNLLVVVELYYIVPRFLNACHDIGQQQTLNKWANTERKVAFVVITIK